ncbi:hydrogenase [Altererythrobacter confluentis]|uniref:Hydrogenase n=1 Tax=Allopontixanthobacter confluentis TaxID=1849021 RepID=A0A6L7GIE9_9SPHN|nr:hydrogenase [Allopontixanthobacter confluentis]MXP15296.1 hydrogenase [Allopontixanthobacter confluentis]
MNLSTHQRTLVVAGALLFLIGLLQGAVVQSFLNPRMALSAHQTAVQSGMAMMIVGALWASADLRSTYSSLARWTIVIGMFGLWAGLTASAATGASNNLPIAGAGYSAAQVTEALVSIAVLGGSVLMTIGWSIFVIGLIRAKR